MPEKLTIESFRSFAEFSDDILNEIVREGERELDARLVTANSSDQRALAVLGLQVTLSLAILGGLASLAGKQPINTILLATGAFLLIGFVVAATFSYFSVFPKLFRYPGNSPENWKIENWYIQPQSEKDSRKNIARVEQCFCLYSAIFDCRQTMEESAELLKSSLAIMMTTIYAGLIVIFLYVMILLA